MKRTSEQATEQKPTKEEGPTKKKVKGPTFFERHGYYCGGVPSDAEIKNDVHSMSLLLEGADPDILLPSLGFPTGLEFECKTKKELGDELMEAKDKPDWCFLQIEHPVSAKTGKPLAKKRMICISHNGRDVSTRMLNMRKGLVTTELVYGKPMKTAIQPTTLDKIAALIAMAPKCNGIGVFNDTSSKI